MVLQLVLENDVRNVLVKLRNAERAPEGAPDPPDFGTLQRMQKLEDIGLAGVMGALIKAGLGQMITSSRCL